MHFTKSFLKDFLCVAVFVAGLIAWLTAAFYAFNVLRWTHAYSAQASIPSSSPGPQGVYRCWQGGRGTAVHDCGLYPLVLKGTKYVIGAEAGVFILNGTLITLSDSQRAGDILENGNVIQLYEKSGETTTYLRQMWDSMNNKN